MKGTCTVCGALGQDLVPIDVGFHCWGCLTSHRRALEAATSAILARWIFFDRAEALECARIATEAFNASLDAEEIVADAVPG